MDAYAKILLTAIAAGLALLVAQGFGLAGTPEPTQASPSSSEIADRYLVMPIPMARLIFRFDRVTGRTWTMPLQPQDDPSWTPIEEAPPGTTARKERKKAPSPSETEAGGPEKAGER